MFFRTNLDIMDEQKAQINIQWQKAKTQMKVFTINDLTARNRKARYSTVSEKIETILVNLVYSYKELFDIIVDKNGDEMKAEQERYTQQKGEIKDFLSKLEERYYDLEEEASKDEVSVSDTDKRVAAGRL